MVNIQQNLVKHIPSLVATWHGQPLAATKQMLSHAEVQAVSKTLLDLQRGLTGDRQLAGAGYMDNSSYLGAYLLYYWPVSYLQISYAMHDVLKNKEARAFSKNNAVRILDLGSGPAPASAAVIDALQMKAEVTLVDSSDKAMTLAKKVFASDYATTHVETVQANFEKDGAKFLEKITQENQFDIIVMSHALNELWRDENNNTEHIEKRAEFIDKVASRLAPNGMILLCQPALLETSRNLLAVADVLSTKQYAIVAPCFASREKCAACPALAAGPNHTCHAEIEWKPCEPVASLAQNAGLDRESVKMTYVALQSESAVEKTKSSSSSKEIVSGRVVSEGMLNKEGRISYLICDGKNRIAVSVKKDDSP